MMDRELIKEDATYLEILSICEKSLNNCHYLTTTNIYIDYTGSMSGFYYFIFIQAFITMNICK